MKNNLKVFINSGLHTEKRGVGFYAQFLSESLSKLDGITLTDKNPDVIHYTYFDLFYRTLPIFKKTPLVVTIHDLTPLVLWRQYPMGFRSLFNLIYQRIALQFVKAVITDSENSKKDLVNIFRLPPGKIFSIPLACDPLFFRDTTLSQNQTVKKKYRLPEKFCLYVGGANPNKNLLTLINTTLKLKIPLVMVGSDFTQQMVKQKGSLKAIIGLQPISPELIQLKTIQNLQKNNSKYIITPGFVPTPDLVSFYKLAAFYCQPSYYEGFGLTVLEAMTAGCPVISSNTSSLPELIGDTCLTFDPYSLLSLEATITSLLLLSPQKRLTLIESAGNRSRQFSWEKCAQASLKVYNKVSQDEI